MRSWIGAGFELCVGSGAALAEAVGAGDAEVGAAAAEAVEAGMRLDDGAADEKGAAVEEGAAVAGREEVGAALVAAPITEDCEPEGSVFLSTNGASIPQPERRAHEAQRTKTTIIA